MSDSRRRGKLYAQHEIRDAAPSTPDLDLSPLASPTDLNPTRNPLSASTSSSAAAAAGDPFVYSFDRTDSPGGPLTLEVFVKPGVGHGKGDQTEKLVEREYEVLDGNGEAVKGRKARAVLRRGGTGSVEPSAGTGMGVEEAGEEDEGFELL
ncbi:hypothetical protein N657DRAFT_643073 [Parathielavia appendiculata]|uniref:Uncharacterized protein n=1 Tax=Parathielavia appendiculata TaxID=2587402 RepID=A0AAN6U4T8_9PEZI|nr:hypothetical protein N657DRAFT_643073 [Parathielavia appendiculata]